MEGLVAGDVVVVSFPFSDLSATKRRPALVVATPSGDDLILAQITSRSVRDGYAVDVANDDFHTGTLKRPSNARPNKLFTADKSIILYTVFPASRRFQTVPSRVASACQPVMLVSASGERQRCRLSRFSRGVHR